MNLILLTALLLLYGLGFVLVGWNGWIAYGSYEPRQLLLLAMVSLWGLRLATHIALRKQNEEGEDAPQPELPGPTAPRPHRDTRGRAPVDGDG